MRLLSRVLPLLPRALPLALSALVLAAVPPAQDPEPEENPLAVLRPLVGDWVAGGTWADGRAFYSRNVFEWGVGERLLEIRSYAGSPEAEVLLFQGFYGWHPTEEEIRLTCYARFGGLYEGTIAPEDGVLRQPYVGSGAGAVGEYLQEFRVEGDAYEWSSYRIEDGEPELLVATTYERVTPEPER